MLLLSIIAIQTGSACGGGMADQWPPSNMPLPTCVILLNLVFVVQTVWVLLIRSAGKIWPSNPTFQGHSIHHVRLPIHSNHRPISYRFLDKQQFQSKITNFSHLHVFNAHAEGGATPCKCNPLQLGIGTWGHKNYSDGATRPRMKSRRYL